MKLKNTFSLLSIGIFIFLFSFVLFLPLFNVSIADDLISKDQGPSKNCQKIFLKQEKESLEAFDPRVLATAESIKTLIFSMESHFGIALLGGLKTPSWEDYVFLNNKIKEFSLILSKLEKGELNQIQKIFSKDQEIIDLQKKLKKQNSLIKPESYGTTDYGLIFHFRNKLSELSLGSGKWNKLKSTNLPPDLNKVKILEQAQAIVKTQSEKIKNSYLEATGFQDREELLKELMILDPELTQKILNKEYELAMYRPRAGRPWIQKVGFHNQFVTGSSHGLLSASRRNLVESSRLKIPFSEYEKYDPDFKPKYGLLVPSLKNLLFSESHYGEDLYIFKKEAVEKRTTITLGDSLNSFESSLRMLDSKTWNEFFVSLDNIELIIPFLKDDFLFGHILSPKGKSMIQRLKINKYLQDRSYVELQYFGPLNLDHVEAFIFNSSDSKPPSGDFLEALKSRNIKIYKATPGKLLELLPD